MNEPLIIAHRGLSSRAPENTMAAFELAVKLGSGGIETDAHLTADGKLVLIHDENTRRTTEEAGQVAAMTLAEIQALDAGSWFDDSFAGQRIPELWQLLELIKPTAMMLNIELKNSIVRYPGLEQAALAELNRLGMLNRIVFSSFNHASMALVKHLDPCAETALLYSLVLHKPVEYAKMCGATGLHPMRQTVDADFVNECHEAGLKIRPWTVDNPDEAEKLAALGVDAIITNCPDELFKV